MTWRTARRGGPTTPAITSPTPTRRIVSPTRGSGSIRRAASTTTAPATARPLLGRFLQPDPIRYRGGINLYAYVNNDPLNLTDPNGLVADGFMAGASNALLNTPISTALQNGSFAFNAGALAGEIIAPVAVLAIGNGIFSRASVATKGTTGLGDLTASEVGQIQDVVDAAGRPLDVVGSTARAARTTRSDIDYTTANANYGNFEGLEGQLPGIDPGHGILRGYADPNVGPSIRFEPGTTPYFVPGVP